MTPEELRSIQAPLKDKYRDEPAAAQITLRAEGKLAELVTCDVQTGHGLVRAGLHPATGGTGREACSAEMLLEALAGCAGVTLNAVATALGVTLNSARVTAEGDLDVRGTLGVDKQTPVGFKQIRLRLAIDSDADPAQLEKLVQLTERYCVVYQTLRSSPEIVTSLAPM